MNCPNCGASAIQSSNGSWICSNQCGWSSGYTPTPQVPSRHDAEADTGPRVE